MVTASALQMHPHCTVIADEDAASSLREIEHYRAVFAYAPEWKDFR
jgi:glucosamine-6-phosphate deaminase